MKRRYPLLIATIVLGTLLGVGAAHAQLRRIGGIAGGAVGAGGAVNLPYQVSDNAGNQWLFYQGGWLQQQGQNQIYSQGAMLQVNGNGVNVPNNRARVDEKTGEVIFENMTAAYAITLLVPGVGGCRVEDPIVVRKDVA